MQEPNLKKLAKELSRSLCGCNAGDCDLLRNDLGLCRTLIQLLAQGRPVAPGALAQASGRRREDVLDVIQSSGNVELDAQGHIVGAGLSLRPTPHRIVLGERTLYAWCALDALMYPPLLNLAAEISSPCAASGDPVGAKVSAAGVRDVTPPSAVVSMIQPDGSASVRQAFCNHVHFFRSAGAAQSWRAGREGVRFLSVEEAFTLGRLLVSAPAT